MKNCPVVSEHVLIAWLCMYRLQHGSPNDGKIDMPSAVKEGLILNGWVEEESHNITDAGLAITDLNGPDWGIDTLV